MTNQAVQSRSVWKRISVLAAYFYIFFLILAFLLPTEPEVDNLRFSSYGDKVGVKGDFVYNYLGEVHIFSYSVPPLVGRASFSTTSSGNMYSSDDPLKELESGKITHSPIELEIYWHGFLLAYLVIWLVVAFLTWIGLIKKGNDVQAPSPSS